MFKYLAIMGGCSIVLGFLTVIFDVPLWATAVIGLLNGLYWRIVYDRSLRK